MACCPCECSDRELLGSCRLLLGWAHLIRARAHGPLQGEGLNSSARTWGHLAAKRHLHLSPFTTSLWCPLCVGCRTSREKSRPAIWGMDSPLWPAWELHGHPDSTPWPLSSLSPPVSVGESLGGAFGILGDRLASAEGRGGKEAGDGAEVPWSCSSPSEHPLLGPPHAGPPNFPSLPRPWASWGSLAM